MAGPEESMAAPESLNIFFIPWFATGHLIPMADVARLFASRGVGSTVVVTPANAALVQRAVDSSSSSGHPIRILLYPFPSAEAGLPPGVENLASLPSTDTYKIDAATPCARPALESLLRAHRPDAVVADVHFGWTASVARDLGIPKLIFHAVGLLPVCAMDSLSKLKPHLSVRDADAAAGTFLIPGLPHPIRMAPAELPEFILRDVEELSTFVQDLREAEASAMGVVVNSFSGIEGAYADHLYETKRLRSWFVGPVSAAANRSKREQAARGSEDGGDSNSRPTTAWLDAKPAGSVVYVCFGSWCHFSDEQMRELASGLESCGHPFLWIARSEDSAFVPEPSEKGMIVKGWAPQVAILGHPAVGAFVTHCGWNSLLEGLTAGLPMVTWPLSTEQFINEKLVVDVLRVGVKNWDGGFRTTVEEDRATVKAEDIAAAVGKIMGSTGRRREEAEGMRKRAKEYGEMARAAVEAGGSSYCGLTSLIDEIRSYKK